MTTSKTNKYLYTVSALSLVAFLAMSPSGAYALGGPAPSEPTQAEPEQSSTDSSSTDSSSTDSSSTDSSSTDSSSTDSSSANDYPVTPTFVEQLANDYYDPIQDALNDYTDSSSTVSDPFDDIFDESGFPVDSDADGDTDYLHDSAATDWNDPVNQESDPFASQYN